MKTVTYTLPAYWASYLINCDPSGLADGEQDEIDRFLVREGLTSSAIDCGQESWFARSNDASNLGGDVMEFSFEEEE